MQSTYFDHPAEESLERFLLNQSEESELEVVETHIMACESCVTRLESLELQIAATKLALQEIHMEKVAKAVNGQQVSWRNWFTLPRLSFVGSAAALALGLAVSPQFLSHQAPVEQVSLVAYRGGETPTIPKNHPLQVHLGANDLSESSVRVQLVNEQGSEIWHGNAPVHKDQIEVSVPAITAGGPHFFRIYSPQGTADGQLLREFAFQVK
jgi:hypothetical protein